MSHHIHNSYHLCPNIFLILPLVSQHIPYPITIAIPTYSFILPFVSQHIPNPTIGVPTHSLSYHWCPSIFLILPVASQHFTNPTTGVQSKTRCSITYYTYFFSKDTSKSLTQNTRTNTLIIEPKCYD